MKSYQKLKLEVKRLKKELSEAQAETHELVDNPHSDKSAIIKIRIKAARQTENQYWQGSSAYPGSVSVKTGVASGEITSFVINK